MTSSSDDDVLKHPKDVMWLAVDGEGRVALFDSGEDGAVPRQAAYFGGRFDALLAGVDFGDRHQHVFRFRRGLSDEEPGLYVRSSSPATPLLVATLPPEARETISRLELPVDFSRAEQVHLADHLADSEVALLLPEWTLRSYGPDSLPSPPPQPAPARKRRVGFGEVLLLLLALALLIWRIR